MRIGCCGQISYFNLFCLDDLLIWTRNMCLHVDMFY